MQNIIPLLVVLLLSQSVISQSVARNSGERQNEAEISVEDLYILANQKRILGKFEDAIKVYKRILDLNEVNASVHHDLARIYHTLEEDEKAISAARKAVRYDQTNHWYLLTLADIYEKNLLYSEASSTLGDVLKIIKDEGLYHRYAEYLDLAEKKMRAIQVYNQADALYGWSEYRSDSKVDLYLHLGKKKEAANEVAKWTQKYPENIDYWTKLARYYEYRGQNKDAKKAYQKVLSLNPNDEEALFKVNQNSKKSKNENDLSELVNDSRIGIDNKIKSILPLLNQSEKLPEAIFLCQSLVVQYPENAKSHALLGDAHWISFNIDDAILSYQSALNLNKSVYQVWDQLMLALAYKKEYNQLGSVAEDALSYYPNQSGPYYYSALSYLSKGNTIEASELNEEAIFISGASGGYIAEQSKILKATILDQEGKTSDAIDFIIKSFEKERSPGLLELLGDLHLKVGDKVSAEKAWKESILNGGDKTRIEIKIQSI